MPIKQNLFKRYLEFDGKRYEISTIRNTKARAEKVAENLRKNGFLARVVPYSALVEVNKYAVYKRRAG